MKLDNCYRKKSVKSLFTYLWKTWVLRNLIIIQPIISSKYREIDAFFFNLALSKTPTFLDLIGWIFVLSWKWFRPDFHLVSICDSDQTCPLSNASVVLVSSGNYLALLTILLLLQKIECIHATQSLQWGGGFSHYSISL